ncbi:hypothetical protein N0V90_002557 [Kalmusia sp. IMI 367209]|nr:hypothetical protein N0V90_002557 [Kalmusia sp. IMI 367209]
MGYNAQWHCTSIADGASRLCLSPWGVTALFQAVKNAHYMVVLPVTGSFLLNLMIIFSTGLFAIQEVGIEAHVPITILEAFNSSNFVMNNTNMSPWVTSYGIQYKNLSYPYGTTEHHVFPRFNVSVTAKASYNRSDTLKTDVDILTFDLPCEKADMGFNEWYRPDFGWYTKIALSTPTCNRTSEVSDLAGPLFGEPGYWSGFRIDISACDGGDPDTLHVNAIIRSANGTVGQPVHTYSNETWHYQFAAIMCTPIYNISRALVSYRADAGSGKPETDVTLSSTAQVSTLAGVTSSDLLKAIWDIYKFTLVQTFLDDVGDDTDWLNDTTVLERVVRTSHNIIGTQIAKEKLLQPAIISAEGTISSIEHRLFVRRLSFGLLEAISIVLAGLVVGMLLLQPPRVCSRDPGPIGSLATILARSHELIHSLRELGAANNIELSQRLNGLSYRTVLDRTQSGRPSFRICQFGSPSYTTSVQNMEDQNAELSSSSTRTFRATPIDWWQPLSASIFARGLVICLPIGVIITLEVLYRKSVSSNGIVAVPTTDTYVRYAWVYIPAIFMFAVKTAFDSTASTLKVFQPYSALRNGGCLAQDSLLSNQLGKTSIQNIWYAVPRRQLSIAAISIAMLLAPFLTIAVSGLYTLEMTNVVKKTIIQQRDVWAISHNVNIDAIKRMGANNQSWMEDYLPGLQVYIFPLSKKALRLFPNFSLTFCSVLTQNLSYPQWTYGEYAFPAIALQDLKNTSTSQNITESATLAERSLLTATIPAIRGYLNCSSVLPDEVEIYFDYRGININISTATTPNCPDWGSSFWCSDYKVSGDPSPLKVGDYFDCYSQYMGHANRTDFPEDNYPPQIPGCPMQWFAYGQLSATNQTTGINVLRCRPYIAQLSVEVSFVLPDFAIDNTNPPKQVPNTEKVLFSELLSISGNTITVDSASPSLVETTPFLNFSTSADTNGLDVWFKALIYGTNGVPAASLLGTENIPTLIENLDRVFGVWMSQIFNSYGRTVTPTDETVPTSLPTYNATLTSPSSARLVQSRVATCIVQVLLGIMAFCAIIAFWKQDTRKVLPKNPGCIAAVASLLAGSSLLSGHDRREEDGDESGGLIFSPGVEFGSERDLAKVFGGWMFSMGWWERKDETPRFAIDVGLYDGRDIEKLRQNNEDPSSHLSSPKK